MNTIGDKLHEIINCKKRYTFPFEKNDIPSNGIYLLFEKGEIYKNWDRIVRVGAHDGQNKLKSRIREHFVVENKDRSIFRKNIGRCILNKENSSYKKIWEIDMTSRRNRTEYSSLIDNGFQEKIEKVISQYIQKNFTFSIIEFDSKADRLFWEKRIIATLAAMPDISPSKNWLGHHSPIAKIRQFGLWQVNGLLNQQLNVNEFEELKEYLK